MRTIKKFVIVCMTAATAMLLFSCKKNSDSTETSSIESSSVTAEVSAWNSLNDSQQAYYEELKKIGQTITEDGYAYIEAKGYVDEWGKEYGNEGIVITSYFGTETIVNVPTEIDGKKVVGHTYDAFRKISEEGDKFDMTFEIKELYYPDHFPEISIGIFSLCESLEKIQLPKSQTTIPFACFRHCINLKEFSCPDEVSVIYEDAFNSCESMTSFKFNNGLKTIDKNAFNGCKSLEKLEFPDTLESIGIQSFQGCTSLKGVNIPSKVKTIPKRAFFYCESLETVNLPEDITTINSEAFSGCYSLKEIYIPETVTEIAENAFEECYDLSIKGKSGSYAEEYAKEYGIDFIEV